MLIRILKCSHDDHIALTLGERRVTVFPQGDPLRDDGLNDVPDEFAPVLRDSHIEFEIVGPADEAGVAPGGSLGDAPAESPLDHDGDGKPGGSEKGAKSTAAKGAAKKARAKKKA